MTNSKQQDKDALDRLKLKNLMQELIANAPDDTLTELKVLYDGIGEIDSKGANDLTLADFGEALTNAMIAEMRPELNIYKKACFILSVSNEASPDNISETELEKACYAMRKGLGLE